MGTIVERIHDYLKEPREMTKDVVQAALLLHEVLDTMMMKTAGNGSKTALNQAGNVREG